MRHTHLLVTLFCLAGATVLGGMVVKTTPTDGEQATIQAHARAEEGAAPADLRGPSHRTRDPGTQSQPPEQVAPMDSGTPRYSYDYGSASRSSGTSFVSLASGRLVVDRRTAHRKPAF